MQQAAIMPQPATTIKLRSSTITKLPSVLLLFLCPNAMEMENQCAAIIVAIDDQQLAISGDQPTIVKWQIVLRR